MENQISKNISVSILYQVLMDETGLEFICQSYELFSRIFSTLVSCNNLHNYNKINNIFAGYIFRRILL